MQRDKLAKMAFAKVSNVIPTQSDSLIAISNRVSILEGDNLSTRLNAAENTIITLQNQITLLLSHVHTYDDSGVSKTTGTPTT